jgi:beta-glucanase (GH16 family)
MTASHRSRAARHPRWATARVATSAAALLAAIATGGAGETGAARQIQEQAKPARHLVFSDEFPGRRLNHRKWNTCYWWNDGGCTNASSHEKQWYLPKNVKVSDGALHLVARRQNVRGSDGNTYAYTSGIVTTGRARESHHLRPRFAFTYGHAVARMRAPAGQGLWSAFWLLPLSQESRPEIDVVEILGHQPGRLHAHYHYVENGENQDPGHNWVGANASRRWHVYAIDWSPRRLVWSVDGKVVWRFTRSDLVPHEPMYLLINLAVGGDWPGDPSGSTKFPSSVDVDYVRVWQRGS